MTRPTPVPRRTKTPKTTTPSRPRVPLIRQTGGRHEDKTKRSWRRRKHKKGHDE